MELEVLRTAARSIKDELLMWALAMAALALVAGLRDRITFLAVLVIGAVLFGLRLMIAARQKPAPAPRQIPLALKFKGHADPDVEVRTCTYELSDVSGDALLKKEGDLTVALEYNGWVCFLPPGLTDAHVIRVTLTDGNGGKWKSGPFRPLFGSRELVPA